MRYEVSGLLRCEVCGVFKRSVGGHVRVHGMTADEYREEYGLNGVGLLSGESRVRYADAALCRVKTRPDIVARFVAAGREAFKHGLPAAYSKRPMPTETKRHIGASKQTESCARGHPWAEHAYYWPKRRAGRGPRKCKACERERYAAGVTA